jgi:L-histidine N-alpha-methyltransferase
VSFRIERLLGPDKLAEQLRREAREGLTAVPKRMRSRWLWDDHASQVYERIMELPEYYLPRAELSILEARAAEIALAARPATVLELGPGSSAKTRVLLDALPGLARFVSVDVSEGALADGGAQLAARYPGLEVVAIVGDFERHLPEPVEPTLVVCLGSTIGGLDPPDRAPVLAAIAAALGNGGALLLGLDLVKPAERIVAAYNDREGLSAALIANLLPVLNRELGADFRPERFGSEAVWNAELERMEMAVRSLEPQTVMVPAIGLSVDFAEDETLRTEISTKFRQAGVERELAAAGLDVESWWTDDAGDFALCLARPAPKRGQAAQHPVAPGAELGGRRFRVVAEEPAPALDAARARLENLRDRHSRLALARQLGPEVRRHRGVDVEAGEVHRREGPDRRPPRAEAVDDRAVDVREGADARVDECIRLA